MKATSKQESGVLVYVGNYGTYELPPELCEIEGMGKSFTDGRTKLNKLARKWGEGRDNIERLKHESNK